eukprot:15045843-Alexandrium_andersonii.AAC.1
MGLAAALVRTRRGSALPLAVAPCSRTCVLPLPAAVAAAPVQGPVRGVARQCLLAVAPCSR